jgi:uncharacterized protein
MRARSWCAVGVAAVAVLTMSWVGVAGAGVSDEGNQREPRTVTVTATGLVKGTPDVLELVVGVQTRDKSAREALDRNNNLAQKVIDALRDAGVKDDDVQTNDLSVSPSYDDDGDINGYEVSNLVTARLGDFDKAGEVIDAATNIAGDEVVIYGVQFSFDDNSLLVARARTEAVKRARAQAQELAKAADVDLGDLLSMTEESAPEPPIFDVAEGGRAADEAAAAPIEPGSETLSVQVTLVYEIE